MKFKELKILLDTDILQLLSLLQEDNPLIPKCVLPHKSIRNLLFLYFIAEETLRS